MSFDHAITLYHATNTPSRFHIWVIIRRSMYPPGKPLTQVITTNGATPVTIGYLVPTLDANPMRASRGDITVHGSVPDIWLFLAHWALLYSVQIPTAVPFLLILFTELWSNEGT